MTNQSLFLIAAVTVLLIMIPGLANASTTSEGFETYTNEDYGFSIEYPSNFQELESNLQEYQVVKFLANYDIPAAALSIFIGKINPNMSLYEAANLTNGVSIRQISMTNTPVSGMPAVERVYYQYENDATAKIKGVYILTTLI